MPEYLDDPSVLTKDKLKSELVAHNVEMPGGNPTKDVYVQLYIQNLTAQNKKNAAAAALDAFSSDEELPAAVVSSKQRSSARKATRKSDKVHLEEFDVTSLTDEVLRDELLKRGVNVGPIVESTRKLYEKKLQQCLENGPAQMSPTEIQVNHNGNSESDLYSDKEDDVVAVPESVIEPEPEPVPVVETRVRSRGKTPVSSQTGRSSSQHQKVEKKTDLDQMGKVEKEVPKELFPGVIDSLTGIGAICRKPIRGAAGRPVISSDLWNDKNSLQFPKTNSSNYSYLGSHAVSKESKLNLSNSTRSSGSSFSTTPATAVPTGPTRAVQHSMSLWKKLALFAVLATFLVFFYLAMEPNSVSPFQDSEVTPSGTV